MVDTTKAVGLGVSKEDGGLESANLHVTGKPTQQVICRGDFTLSRPDKDSVPEGLNLGCEDRSCSFQLAYFQESFAMATKFGIHMP